MKGTKTGLQKDIHSWEAYDFERCKVCGECLSHCPVLKISKEDAREEMQRLREGRPSQILNKCTSCMACNLFCEQGCNPYQLILKRWNERYSQKGIISLIEAILPYSSPNLWDIFKPLLPEDEKKRWGLLEEAANNPSSLKGAEDILYLGCNQFLDPYITFAKILGALPALGSPRLCCGEPLY
jgi:ferredoxin